MEKVYSEVFKASDGTLFFSEEDCLEHEKYLEIEKEGKVLINEYVNLVKDVSKYCEKVCDIGGEEMEYCSSSNCPFFNTSNACNCIFSFIPCRNLVEV